MARLPRLSLAQHAHYVLQHTVHGQDLAHDDADRAALLDALAAAAAAQQVASSA